MRCNSIIFIPSSVVKYKITASSSNSAPGGSQDYGSVRTRNDLAMLINQNTIKQEIEVPAEEEGREMDVDDGNEPVLYLGESHPGEGETDDSFIK
jgi:hypothetical protein